jgi:hypothetical protein
MSNGKILVKIVIVAALVGCTALGYMVSQRLGRASKPGFDEKATLTLLRTEVMKFLVMRRTTTQIVIEHHESFWWGDWRGVVWGTVKWEWGINMDKLKPSDIRRDGPRIICHLPDPEELGFSCDPSSIHSMASSTPLAKLDDLFSDDGGHRELLQIRLWEHAKQFSKEQKLRPDRDELVKQLNSDILQFNKALGVDILFE